MLLPVTVAVVAAVGSPDGITLPLSRRRDLALLQILVRRLRNLLQSKNPAPTGLSSSYIDANSLYALKGRGFGEAVTSLQAD